MTRPTESRLFAPGETISFRLPPDTPSTVIDYLNATREKEGRKFSSVIAPIFVQAILLTQKSESDKITLDLPGKLDHDEREWLSHKKTQQVLSGMLFQMIKGSSTIVIQENEMKEQRDDQSNSFKVDQFQSKIADSMFDDED